MNKRLKIAGLGFFGHCFVCGVWFDWFWGFFVWVFVGLGFFPFFFHLVVLFCFGGGVFFFPPV